MLTKKKNTAQKSPGFIKIEKVIKKRHKDVKDRFDKKHKKTKRFFKKHGKAFEDIRTAGAIALSTAAIAGAIATTPSVTAEQIKAEEQTDKEDTKVEEKAKKTKTPPSVPPAPEPKEEFAKKIQDIIAGSPTLNSDQEKALADLLSDRFNIKAAAELEGNRLNTTYGLIGGEQHLPRYPGDTATEHYNNDDIYPQITGITPSTGAWGHFAPSHDALTEDLRLKEQHYVAVQTFLAPGWNIRSKELYQWFRYRKMVVVNTQTGDACVAVIGDAGPSTSTGKSFGGSAEVMIHLKLSTGSRKGPVLIYFVNDSEDKVPLGPIEAKYEKPHLF